MRKKLAATIAAGAAAVLMLSGSASAMTVQELSERSKSAMAQIGSLKADIQGNAAANLRVSQEGENGATMDIPINGMFSVNTQLNMEPFQLGLQMEYRGEAMGQGMDGKMSAYILEKDDGTADAYLGTYSSAENVSMQWDVNTADAQQLGQVKDAVRAMLAGDSTALASLSSPDASFDPSAAAQIASQYQDQILGLTTVSPQTVMVDGKECWQMTADLTGNDLLGLVSGVMTSSGQTLDDMSAQMLEAVLSGIRIRIESDIDAQTFLPVYTKIDLGGSDFSAIGDLIVASMMGAEGGASAMINVSALDMTGSFDCNSPVQITVPEEAKALAGAQSAASPEDLIGGLLTGGTDGGDLTGGIDLTGGGDLTSGSDLTGVGDLTGGSDLTGGTDDTGDEPNLNADGTYTLRYEDYSGNVKEAVITPPEGLRLSYGTGNYLAFSNDDYSLSVTYSLYSADTPMETVEEDLDVSYMNGDSDYSDVMRTQVMQTTLPDGRSVSYGTKAFNYGEYRLGGTCCAIQAGNWVVDIEIEKKDENYNFVESGEQDVITYAGCVSPAA